MLELLHIHSLASSRTRILSCPVCLSCTVLHLSCTAGCSPASDDPVWRPSSADPDHPDPDPPNPILTFATGWNYLSFNKQTHTHSPAHQPLFSFSVSSFSQTLPSYARTPTQRTYSHSHSPIHIHILFFTFTAISISISSLPEPNRGDHTKIVDFCVVGRERIHPSPPNNSKTIRYVPFHWIGGSCAFVYQHGWHKS